MDNFNTKKLKELRNQTPFFVFSKKALIDNVKKYQNCLPSNTEICYAMKANSEKPVLTTLQQGNVSFEVASKYELSILKTLGILPSKILYGTSVKPADHINEFAKYGVDRFAFDSEQELLKIAKYSPNARVYVRALVDDKSNSIFHMSEKFGASLDDCVILLLKAKQVGLVPYGISFNVGSQARNPEAWSRGIDDVIKVMKELFNKGIKINAINIGGGFPHGYQDNDGIPSIEQICKYISGAIKKIPYEVDYIAEPGRGLTADTFVLIAKVIAKIKRYNGNWLYVDAGVYDALLEAMAYQGSTRYKIATINKYNSETKEHFILTGPTGDNLDVIDKDVILPADIEIGDKIIVYDVGAYTFPLITKFNGFPKPRIIIQ